MDVSNTSKKRPSYVIRLILIIAHLCIYLVTKKKRKRKSLEFIQVARLLSYK